MKVLFFINARSGTGGYESVKKTVDQYCAERPSMSYHIEMLKADINKEQIQQHIHSYNPEVVAVAGGDGSVNLISSILCNTEVSMLIIPAGSANGMAKELNILRVDQAIQLLWNGVKQKIDLLNINGQHCIHLSDVGFNARIVKRFESDPRRGLLTYARHMLAELFLIRSHRFYITADGNSFSKRAVSVTFANASKYGTGMVINPTGQLDDGKFELVIIKPFPRIHLLSIAWKMIRGTLQNSEFVQVVSCSTANVRLRKKTTLQIDGEVIGKTRNINIKIIPQSLNLLVPAPLTAPEA